MRPRPQYNAGKRSKGFGKLAVSGCKLVNKYGLHNTTNWLSVIMGAINALYFKGRLLRNLLCLSMYRISICYWRHAS